MKITNKNAYPVLLDFQKKLYAQLSKKNIRVVVYKQRYRPLAHTHFIGA